MNQALYNTLLINIDELWLKGMNRPFYFRTLRKNIIRLMTALGRDDVSVSTENQRFILKSGTTFRAGDIEAASRIPGVNAVIPAIRIGKNYQDVFPAVLEEIRNTDLTGISDFRIFTKRADKSFPVGSMDVSKEIGTFVIENFPGLRARMENPGLQIEIRILTDHIYISSKKIPAPGGLPVGTNGHLVTMISGGIDSPVASYLMSKRGCRQTFMFFYAYPMVGEDVRKKIEILVSTLGRYQSGSRLYIIKFGDFQKKLVRLCRDGYRTILFRKYMMECGSILAGRIGAEAILTGDSLGQVSSQTLANISEIDHFTDISILRPLIGLNKREIINLSIQIGTYDTSIIPFDDACSLLAPRHPVLKAERSYLEHFFNENRMREELEILVNEAEIIRIDPAGRLQGNT